jgi:hypothetical protein
VNLTLKMTATEAIYGLVSTTSVFNLQSRIGLINASPNGYHLLELDLRT